jgi:Immunoglobulin-like domain of bacterial spore germination
MVGRVRLWVGVVAALVACLVLPQAAAAVPLTATQIRIADHPGFVRVVVDFSGGTVAFNELEATDPDPFADGFARVRLIHPGVKSAAMPVRADGVFARIAQSGGRVTIRLSAADRQFKYLSYVVQHGPERVVFDLFKSSPPSDDAEITHGHGGCLTFSGHSVSKTRVRAAGRERNLFEHQFQVVLRRRGGRIQREHHVAADSGRWHTSFTYPHAGRQTGTLEAVDLSEKDGALVCLVQVRVRFGG